MSGLATPTEVGCGIESGAVKCWNYPALGAPSEWMEALVEQVPSGAGWAEVGLSQWRGCALATSGGVSCWGPYEMDFVPPTGSDWVHVAMQRYGCELCALDATGHVQCFGTTAQMEEGTCREQPLGDDVYVDIESGASTLVALRADGGVDSWLNDKWNEPTHHDGDFVKVAGDLGSMCALDTQGALSCWGGSGVYPTPSIGRLTGRYTELAVSGATVYVIDEAGQLHWNRHEAVRGETSFWDVVGVPNPDEAN